jgi:pilus assembly protein CpaF
MPIISTLHKNILSNGETYVFEKDRNDLGTIVSNITFNILRDSPGLVADVANGLVDRSVLETSIIKDIDKNKYHYGIFREELIKKVLDFMFGYGELQQYIEDEDITDIDGTKYNEFVIKRNGVRKKVNVNFGSEKIFDTYCKLIAIRNGGILNENDSHCRVTDEKWHLRINVSIKPRNISGTLGDFAIEGNFWGMEFSILKSGRQVAQVSKKWFSWNDTYGVDIADTEDYAFILCLVIVIDQVLHDNNRNNG